MKTLCQISFIIIISLFYTTTTFAHKSPDNCFGSGLQISLFVSSPQVHIGDIISYSISIFNGIGNGPIVCDATDIQASIVTPDGENHPITLTRTTLTNGQKDSYSNIVSYTARNEDVKADGTLVASASDTGSIHQNDTNSSGGANQSLNVTIIEDEIIVPTTPTSTPPTTPPVIENTYSGSSSSGGSTIHYGCKDQSAVNYEYFSSSNPDLCKYAAIAIVTPAIVPTPTLPYAGFAPKENNGLFYALLSLIRELIF